MTDAQLLRAAIDASGLVATRSKSVGQPSTRAFARSVLDMNESNARQVLLGTKALGRSARVLCMLVVLYPKLVPQVVASCRAATGKRARVAERGGTL